MSAEENGTLEKAANKFKLEVCDAMHCGNPAIDFVMPALFGRHFFLNHCESHPEKIPELKDPTFLQQ